MSNIVALDTLKIGSFADTSLEDRLDLPLVSIIMPAFNAEQTISQSIQSILAQTYLNWELIIVDDCSTDSTPEIIHRYCRIDNRIRYIKMETNVRQARARNCAISEAEGRFIAFLDSDDLWYAEKLSVQVWTMLENDLPFSYSSYALLERKPRNFVFNPPSFLSYDELLKSNSIGCLTVVYDTAHLGKRYMPVSIDRQEDYALWLDITKELGGVYGISMPLASYRIVSGSLSSNKMVVSKSQWHVYRFIRGLDFIESFYYQAHYMIKGFLKYRIRREANS